MAPSFHRHGTGPACHVNRPGCDAREKSRSAHRPLRVEFASTAVRPQPLGGFAGPGFVRAIWSRTVLDRMARTSRAMRGWGRVDVSASWYECITALAAP